MDKRYIKVGNTEYERIFLGENEIGFGFVGNDQFFGQLFEYDGTLKYTSDSTFTTQGSITVDVPEGINCTCKWYYSSTNSLTELTLIEGESSKTLQLKNEYAEMFIICKPTLTKQYYYGSVELTPIISSSKIVDNRTGRSVRIGSVASPSFYYSKGVNELPLTITPITEITSIDQIHLSLIKNVAKDEECEYPFISLYYNETTSKYMVKYDVTTYPKVTCDQYSYVVSIDATENYKEYSGTFYIRVNGETIEYTSKLSGDTAYGSTVLCSIDQILTDATVTYQWYIGENAIEGETNESFTIDNSSWIGEEVKCIAYVYKTGYNTSRVETESATITKGIVTLEWTTEIEDPMQIIGNTTLELSYKTAHGIGSGVFTINGENDTYFTIENDIQNRILKITGLDLSMTASSTIDMYINGDAYNNSSNTISVNIKTYKDVWNGFTLDFSGNTYVGQTLSLSRNSSDDPSNYSYVSIQWYYADDGVVSNWVKTGTDNSTSLLLTSAYQGKYIGCIAVVKRDNQESTITILSKTPVLNQFVFPNNAFVLTMENPYYSYPINGQYTVLNNDNIIVATNINNS